MENQAKVIVFKAELAQSILEYLAKQPLGEALDLFNAVNGGLVMDQSRIQDQINEVVKEIEETNAPKEAPRKADPKVKRLPKKK